MTALASGCSSCITCASTRPAIRGVSPSMRVALVGIDPDPGIRPRRTHGPHPRQVELRLAGELDFQGPRAGIAARAFGHVRRGSSAPRVKVVSSGLGGSSPASSHTGLPVRRASSSHSAQSSALRAPAGGQQRLQCCAVDARLDHRAAGFEGCDHVRGIVIEVIDARGLAATAMLAVVDRDDDRVLAVEHEPGDAKRRGERQVRPSRR